jgi:hypothetical protein
VSVRVVQPWRDVTLHDVGTSWNQGIVESQDMAFGNPLFVIFICLGGSAAI